MFTIATINCTPNSSRGTYNFEGIYKQVATVTNSTGAKIQLTSFSAYLGMLGSVTVGGSGVGDTVKGLGKPWSTTARFGDSNVSNSTTISAIVTTTGTLDAGGTYPRLEQTAITTFAFPSPYILSAGASVDVYLLMPGGTGTTNVMVLDLGTKFSTHGVSPYVEYIPYTFTVSYNANGGTGAPSSQTKTGGTPLTLSSTVPTRSSSTLSNFTVTLNANGGSCSQSSLSAVTTRNFSFSHWTDSDGSSYSPGGQYTKDKDAVMTAQYSHSDTGGTVSLPIPTRSNNQFLGWSESSSGGSYVSMTYRPTKNITLYAIWKQSSYSLTVYGNGGTVVYSGSVFSFNPDTSSMISSMIPAGSTINLSDFSVIYDEDSGKRLVSWNTNQSGTGSSYSITGSFNLTSNVSLYAQSSSPSNITVTWMDGHTSTPIKTKSYPYGSSAPKSDYPPDPIWDGHSFKGWFGSASLLQSDTKITAMWGTSPVWIMTESGWAKYSPKKGS